MGWEPAKFEVEVILKFRLPTDELSPAPAEETLVTYLTFVPIHIVGNGVSGCCVN
ncbi:MAG: hypothetical protein H7240_00015 [Glaciimonas sp.]|nr:hypothetical protein [Glaciimonas sp.]